MIKNLFSYIKRKYEKNTLSWKLVSPPGIIAGIIQLVRSLIFSPFSVEVISEPIYIWYTRLSLSIITIIFGTISFIIMLSLAFISTVVATYLPVRKAAKRKPVESIRAL